MEAGLRALGVLASHYPAGLQLDQLVMLDHIVVHSRDFGDEAPDSLHPPSPYRKAEPIVRRELIRLGLDLMVARGLIQRLPTKEGFRYSASEYAASFMSALQEPYWVDLFKRGAWAAERFGDMPANELSAIVRTRVDDWIAEFSETIGEIESPS